MENSATRASVVRLLFNGFSLIYRRGNVSKHRRSCPFNATLGELLDTNYQMRMVIYQPERINTREYRCRLNISKNMSMQGTRLNAHNSICEMRRMRNDASRKRRHVARTITEKNQQQKKRRLYVPEKHTTNGAGSSG